MAVRLDLNMSLDGIAAPEPGTPEKPFHEDWGRLVEHYTATRTFRERVLHDSSGEGTTGVDDAYARAYFDGIGVEIMGAGKFGLSLYGDDPAWRGWWGDEPPFGTPVYVLTHRAPRPSLAFANGTVFHFVDMSYEDVLERALSDAGDQDVRIGGGVTVAREYLRRGLVDTAHLAISPIVLGQGLNLWEGLRGFEELYDIHVEPAQSGVIHANFTRR
jgi:dihydrofolate reductase